MPLKSGVRLGPYEILSPLGAGGMGEVYRATDTRLDRTVAIKILPSTLASDPELRERFDREARTISQLRHPHICTLHDVGHQDGIDFLVMEHLEGETLEARLARGALPSDEALRIAIQLAGALDTAHRAGIVHRDLKPANIMLTKSSAKLLDFGLAKALVLADGLTGTVASPTLTARGTILGTVQYMAPEQIDGQEADARTDIFAFGVVLYEMIAGRKAFEGTSQASLMGAILKDQPPPISSLQPVSPAALDHVVARCLAKDPDARWQSAADLAGDLQWIASAVPNAIAAPGRAGMARAERLLWIAAVLVAATGAATMWLLTRSGVSRPSPTVRAAILLPADQAHISNGQDLQAAISPDGRLLVYLTAVHNVSSSLYLRALNAPDAHLIPGTDGALTPFFSPDGRSVGFQAGRSLKVVALGGGAPTTLVDGLADLRGADWGDDGWIYFSPKPDAGLWRVRAEGGTPEALTTPDRAHGEKTHRWPFVLPGARAVLFVVGTSRNTSFDDARIEVLSLDTRKRRVLITGGMYPRYVASGHIVYGRNGAILAAPFDLQSLELRGPGVTVQDGVQTSWDYGLASFASSRNGTLIYVPDTGHLPDRTLVFGDRRGGVMSTSTASGAYYDAHLSPDGTRIAVGLDGATSQIELLDLARQGATSRLTHEWDNQSPRWTRDGAWLAFASNRHGGNLNIYWQAADGGDEGQRLTTSDHDQAAGSWSLDGKTFAYVDLDPVSLADVWVVDVTDRKARPFVKTPFDEWSPAFSPDGRWLAYASKDSGRPDVYVQAFPAGGRRWQVSTGGGNLPLWNPKGGELFYVTLTGDVMAVPIETSPQFHSGTPVRLFKTDDVITDVTRDGRFLMIHDNPRPSSTHFNVVFNWFEELATRAVAVR